MSFSLRSPFSPSAAFLMLAALLAGCSSPSSTPPAPSPAPAPTANTAPAHAPVDPAQQLRKGLTAAEVTSLLGEPQKKSNIAREGVTLEIWTYERTSPGPKRQVQASMRDVPYVDPLTGVMRTIQEPVYELESTQIIVTTQLLLHAGTLLEWKQQITSERAFN